MAAHKDFVKLLTDIEIYVDGIAAMQLKNLNAYVNLAKGMLEKKYNPGDNDRHLRIFNDSHINKDEYFTNIVHSDIDDIIADIKEAHRGDSTNAPEDDFVEEWKRDIEFVSSIEGTSQKRQAILYCRRLSIDYTKLTEVEFEVLIRVLQKSKKLKVPEKIGRKSDRKIGGTA
ncbi:hypothetical protein [Beduinella massiliensis]|uniref:hypothetical protein n=1 Tax=Beduinella massiliensis TaxID=1852363 RepID=UPI003D154610